MNTTIIFCILIGYCLVESAPIKKLSSVITISVGSDLVGVSCVYKEMTLRDGDQITDGACRKCRCEGGVVVCQEIMCPRVNSCERTHTPEGSCCPVCSDTRNETFSLVEYCVHNSVLHSRGDKWQTDSCTECECVAGSEVRCVTTECDTSMPCWQVADQHNQCCPQCQVKACNTRGGLKREGDTWLESGQVVTCRDHFVEPVNCQTVCSNHIDSLECQLCTSSEITHSVHSCGQRNVTFHQSDGCVSIRPVAMATNNCPQKCINNNNNNMLCCKPTIRERLIKHSCGNHGKKFISLPIVTRCLCHNCED